MKPDIWRAMEIFTSQYGTRVYLTETRRRNGITIRNFGKTMLPEGVIADIGGGLE